MYTISDMIELAFTTRIPLAVMITMGIKQWENRVAFPKPPCGQCAITCSKSSGEREYNNFLNWAKCVFRADVAAALPEWSQVAHWRGKLVAVCDYKASYTAPNPPIWDEGYPVWWHLSNVRLLNDPIPCRGDVGMWRLQEDICKMLLHKTQ